MGIVAGARRKPKRHTGQDVQVFSLPPTAHALPVRRNDILFSGVITAIIVKCWSGFEIFADVS